MCVSLKKSNAHDSNSKAFGSNPYDLKEFEHKYLDLKAFHSSPYDIFKVSISNSYDSKASI